MRKLALVSLAIAGIVSAATVVAQTKPEDAIKLRKAGMALIGYNFASLGAMVNEKKPYNKDEAIRNAVRIDALSSHPFEFFGTGTDKGADHKASAAIWKDHAKFDQVAMRLQNESTKLVQVARTGDMAALKTQFGATAQTCKACHDDFREK